MARKRVAMLELAPFPALQWDGYFWSSTIKLSSWKGFQNRQGPYGRVSSRRPSDGTVRLAVHSPDDSIPAPPLTEQGRAFQYLLDHEKVIHDTILRSMLNERPWDEAVEEAEDESLLSLRDATRPSQIREHLGLANVLVHTVAKSRLAYIGFEFGCSWEQEHGCGVMMHRKRI